MFLFSKRRELEAEFYEWAKKYKVAINPFNVITWLVGVKGFDLPKEICNDNQ